MFFSSSRSLLNVSCIFSIPFLRSWIIFIIITVNSFSDSLPISSSFIWSCGILPCSYVCSIFLCYFILSNLLCLWIPSGMHMPINIPCTREFSGIPASRTLCSHSRGRGLTPDWGTKIPQATQCELIKYREKKLNKDKQNKTRQKKKQNQTKINQKQQQNPDKQSSGQIARTVANQQQQQQHNTHITHTHRGKKRKQKTKEQTTK